MGERVAAEINVSGASGMVTVTDVVPSGMRFCSLDFDSEWNGWSVLHVEGQRVTFVWYPDELGSEPTPLVYTAACVDQGGYISEQTFARCEGEGTLGGSWGMSERSDVSISR